VPAFARAQQKRKLLEKYWVGSANLSGVLFVFEILHHHSM
jgi:hypothetical protein